MKTTVSSNEQPVDAPRETHGLRPAAIVGVGASAGGLEALEELFHHMPTGTGVAFVVVTHLHPGHDSLLLELLGRITDVPVIAATQRLQVEADHIYVGQPGGQLSIIGGVLQRLEEDEKRAPKNRSTTSCVHWRRTNRNAQLPSFYRVPVPMAHWACAKSKESRGW